LPKCLVSSNHRLTSLLGTWLSFSAFLLWSLNQIIMAWEFLCVLVWLPLIVLMLPFWRGNGGRGSTNEPARPVGRTRQEDHPATRGGSSTRPGSEPLSLRNRVRMLSLSTVMEHSSVAQRRQGHSPLPRGRASRAVHLARASALKPRDATPGECIASFATAAVERLTSAT
jgi:hypothetical protein